MTADWSRYFPENISEAAWVCIGEPGHDDLDEPLNRLRGNAWLLPQKEGALREILWLDLRPAVLHPADALEADSERWGDEDSLPGHRRYMTAAPADLEADVAMLRGYLHRVIPEVADVDLPAELIAADCSPIPNAAAFTHLDDNTDVYVCSRSEWTAFALMLQAKAMPVAAEEILNMLRLCDFDISNRIKSLANRSLEGRIRICFEEHYGVDGGDWLSFARELDVFARGPKPESQSIPPLAKVAALARSSAASPLLPAAVAKKLTDDQRGWLDQLAAVRYAEASELIRGMLGIWTLPAHSRPGVLEHGMALVPGLIAALSSARLLRVASSRNVTAKKGRFESLLSEVLSPHDALMQQAFGFSLEALSVCSLSGIKVPLSLSELAAVLLLPVIPPMPRHLQGEDPGLLFARWAGEWSAAHANDTPEELALEYLRCGTRAQVQTSTGVLLRTGSPEQQNALVSLLMDAPSDRRLILTAAALPMLASGEPAFHPAGMVLLDRTIEDMEQRREELEASGLSEWVMGEVNALREAAQSASPETLIGKVAAGRLELGSASGSAQICFGRLSGEAMQRLALSAVVSARSGQEAIAVLDLLEAWPGYREAFYQSRPAAETRDMRLSIDDAAAEWLRVLNDQRPAITGSCAVREVAGVAALLMLQLDARHRAEEDPVSDFLDNIPIRGMEWAVAFARERLAVGPSCQLPDLTPASAEAWPALLETWHHRLSSHDLAEKLDALPLPLLSSIAEDDFAEAAGDLEPVLKRQSLTLSRLRIPPECTAATRFFTQLLHAPLTEAAFLRMVAWLEKEAAGGHFGVVVIQSIAPWRGMELWWLPDLQADATWRTFPRLEIPDRQHGHDVYIRASMSWHSGQWPVDVFGQLHYGHDDADEDTRQPDDSRDKFLKEVHSHLSYLEESSDGNNLSCLLHSFSAKENGADNSEV